MYGCKGWSYAIIQKTNFDCTQILALSSKYVLIHLDDFSYWSAVLGITQSITIPPGQGRRNNNKGDSSNMLHKAARSDCWFLGWLINDIDICLTWKVAHLCDRFSVVRPYDKKEGHCMSKNLCWQFWWSNCDSMGLGGIDVTYENEKRSSICTWASLSKIVFRGALILIWLFFLLIRLLTSEKLYKGAHTYQWHFFLPTTFDSMLWHLTAFNLYSMT